MSYSRNTSYKDLIVWKKSLDLVHEIYKITKKFPKTEAYALASQMQRAAVSIPSNIAEGQSRGHISEFIQFLHIAYGSSSELETQLIIANREYVQNEYSNALQLLEEVQKMLSTLIKSLKTRHSQLITRN